LRCRCAQPKGHHRQESRARARGGLKCNIYIYMYMYIHTHIVCFEGKKKAQIFLPPAAGETPDPCHLSGPEMISYTFRHHTPSDTIHLGLPGGAAGAMDIRPLPRPQIFAGIDTGNTHRRGSQTVLHQVLACITSSRILRVGVLRGAGAQLLLGLVGAKAIQSELVAQCIPLLALYVQARGASGGRQVRDGTVLCRLRCNLRCVLKLKILRQVCACVTGLIEVNK